jgi:hypothetical protein
VTPPKKTQEGAQIFSGNINHSSSNRYESRTPMSVLLYIYIALMCIERQGTKLESINNVLM